MAPRSKPAKARSKAVAAAAAIAPDFSVAASSKTATPAADLQAALHAEAHGICPGCGAQLVDRGCKMRCLRCGFFLDCSDG